VVLGDGGMFFRRATPKYADVYQPTQKVYIRWDGSQERLLIQTKYEGPAEEMVWIVPVPSEPTVERADGAIFNDLSKLTYDPAIDYTDFIGLDSRTWVATAGGGSGSSSSPVEWHERIGDYDVALLRPVGGEDVIQWLNANDFAVPETINPVLEDYVADGWWMVAARIYPDALSVITSEKLAKGTLHPLEMTFQSEACVFPMRLTRMAAGPVEELIYIEGPAHYEPATLVDGNWQIDLFGGPVREVTEGYTLTNLQHTTKILDGEVQVATSSRLTKLRRVFFPEEMTEDLVFQELDLPSWLAGNDLSQIAQAATQYGRWRDPNGVAPLDAALSAEALTQVIPPEDEYMEWPSPSARFLTWGGMQMWSWSPSDEKWLQYPGCAHLRSCIWALGEIGIKHEIGQAAREKLLRCARHDNQFIRMEAYVALTKTRSETLGSILIDRLTDVLGGGVLPNLWTFDLWIPESELDLATDWIVSYGAPQQKDAWIDTLNTLIADVNASSVYHFGPEYSAPVAYNWPEWIIWRAARTQDERLLPTLEELHSQLPPGGVDSAGMFLWRAEAACGLTGATATVVRTVLDDEAQILSDGQAPGTGGLTSLDNYYNSMAPHSLRVQILRRQRLACVLFPMPTQAADTAIRLALSDEAISDWYVLYLLAGIKEPTAADKEQFMRIWDSQDEDRRLLAIDVLYVWGDVQMLMELYASAGFAEIKSEIGWASAALKASDATSIIEEQIHDSWNPDWLALNLPFIHPLTDRIGRPLADHLNEEMKRVEHALYDYFHPTSGILDEERLAALKRVAADETIHAGMRFDLLGVDYGGTEWGLPLLEQAARDILAVDTSDATVHRINSMMKSVGDSGFVVEQ